MARLAQGTAWFTRLRFRTWFTERLTCLKSHSETSKYRIAKEMGVQVSRINDWLDGSRTVTADTAFEIGEVLWRLGEGLASGPVALYACGYLSDLVRFLNQLALYGQERNGPRHAVTLYCSLPALMMWVDYACLTYISRKREMHIPGRIGLGKIDESIIPVDWTFRLRLVQNIDPSLLSSNHVPEPLMLALKEVMEAPGVPQLYDRAWRNIMRDPDSVELPIRKMKSRNNKVEQANGTKGQSFVDDEMKRVARYVMESGLELIRQHEATTIAHAAVQVANVSAEKYPLLLGPRMWRLLSEWAYLMDSDTYSRLCVYLPSAFRFYEHERREQTGPVGAHVEVEKLNRLHI